MKTGSEIGEVFRKGYLKEDHLHINHAGFYLRNDICIAVENNNTLLLNNPSSSLLITNRYHSSRMNNLRKKIIK
jgi:hypothetical protein